MIGLMKRTNKNRTGQAIVEMAVIFPFFLLIVIGGLIDFGFAFYNYLTLQQIAADAARYGAEGNGNKGLSHQQIRDFAFTRKPVWWTGNFVIPPVVDVKSSDGEATIRKVYLVYDSPVMTPFYVTMFDAVSGIHSLRLSVAAAYQIPEHCLESGN